MKRLVSALVATLVLGALVMAFLDLKPSEMGEGVAERLRSLSGLHVGLAFLVYLGSYLGRALRFAVLLPGLSGVVHLASIAGRHNFLNLVLPLRSGELALPWMLQRECGRPLAEGGAALIVCRVLDLFCVAAYLSLGIAWNGVAGKTADQASTQATLVLLSLGLGLLLMGPLSRWVARRLPTEGKGKLSTFVARACTHLGDLSLGRLLAAAGISLATWALTYTTYYFLVTAMGSPAASLVTDPVGHELGSVGFARSLVGTTGLHLSTVLPVNTLGGLGSWEAGWVAGYTLLAEVSKEAAGISAVVTHLVNFVFIAIIGGAGFLLRKKALPPGPTTGATG